jgi:hypothetical protein
VKARRPRYPKPDSNQAAYIRLMLARGYEVINVSPLGGDALDVFVGGAALWRLGCPTWLQVEVKDVDGKLTPGEQEYIDRHEGWPVLLVQGTAEECVIQTLEWFGWVA